MNAYRWERIVAESLPLLMVTLLLELLAGRVLLHSASALLETAPLLALLPLLNATGGNVGSILGARLSSGLHGGTMEPKLAAEALRKEMQEAGLLGVLAYTGLAILIYLGALVLPIELELSFFQLMVIMVGTGLLLILFVVFLAVGVALWGYRRGFDPDNLVPPAVTTGCDVAGIVCLVMMVGLVI